MHLKGPAQRIKSLDGLRAFAVLFVFLFHALPDVFPGGFIGVDIFFVLSGFVITLSLLDEQISFKRFYLRRFFRIIPPIIPVLIVAIVAGRLGHPIASWLDIIAAGASFLNWVRAFDLTTGMGLAHFWSLSIEEQFYLLWPICLFVLLRKADWIIPALAAAILVLTFWQLYLWHESQNVVRIYNGLDTRASQLLLGCLLAFFPRRGPGKALPIVVAIFVLALFTLPVGSAFYMSFGIVTVGLLAMLLIAACAWSRTPIHSLLELQIVQWAGKRSYALYLWHFPPLWFLERQEALEGVHHVTVMGIALVFTCLAAELSWHAVESPARLIRQHIEMRWLRGQRSEGQ